jgi:hypothetical protein
MSGAVARGRCRRRRARRAPVQPRLLGRVEHPRAGEKPDAERRLEREAGTTARHDVDQELGVPPGVELPAADVERRPFELTQ